MPLGIGIGLPLEFTNAGAASVGPPVPGDALLDEDSIALRDEDSNILLEET